MKSRFCRWFWTLGFIAVLVSIPGCSGVGGQSPEPATQQLPFTQAKPLVIPANAIIYVRLRQAITSSTAQAGDNFNAVVDEPLLVDSQVAIPQGTEAAVKVVGARESGRLHTAGYVRITLSSINLNGKTVAMQTNSAIAGGGRFKSRNLGFVRTGVGSPLTNSFVSHSFQASDAESTVPSGKQEAGFAANLRIGFRLTQPLTLD